MVEKAKQFFNFDYTLGLRDIALIVSILLAGVGWWHRIELNDAQAGMQFSILCERVEYIENTVLPKIVKAIEDNRNLEDKRYERQTKQIAENSQMNSKIDVLITEMRMLSKKVEDLIDGKYKIK
jgi:hypothetical protein